MSIVEGLKSTNEIRQSEAASELAEMLLLGNEDNLPNMPMRDIIQCLCVLLQKEHNFELVIIMTFSQDHKETQCPYILDVDCCPVHHQPAGGAAQGTATHHRRNTSPAAEVEAHRVYRDRRTEPDRVRGDVEKEC